MKELYEASPKYIDAFAVKRTKINLKLITVLNGYTYKFLTPEFPEPCSVFFF